MVTLNHYSPLEDKWNALTHAAGCFLSLVALAFLYLKGHQSGSPLLMLSVLTFGITLVALYLASTLYHSSKNQSKRKKYKVLDHAAIYLLIAGTYTPFTVITLNGTTGWVLFFVTWSFAITGVTLKIFYAGQFKVISTLLYVLMGWLIVFAIDPLLANLAQGGVYWLLAGGIIYTVGALIYALSFIPFNHAIFHCFVMLGSFCHFIAVYLYVQ